MSNHEKLLDEWLSGGWLTSNESDQEIWEPGFEIDRRIVVSHLGFYQKVFARPDGFVKRFYHHVYELSVDKWHIKHQVQLYGGFCTINAEVDIHSQATLKYAQANTDILTEINQHIRVAFEGLIFDLIDHELFSLDDGDWIKSGLRHVEKLIDSRINELMLVKHIQCRALSSLQPAFADIEEDEHLDARFVHESVYLNVAQKNFEFQEKQQQELFRQQQREEQIKLQQSNVEEELERERQAQEFENAHKRLLEKEQQQKQQHEIENRMHTESTRHVIQLRELASEAELQAEDDNQARTYKMQQKMLSQQLAHENRTKEKKLFDEIKEAERRELQWNKSKQHLHDEKLAMERKLKLDELEMQLDVKEARNFEELKNQERLESKRLLMDSRLKDMQLETDVTEQKKRFDATNRSTDYMHREIELLVLEKQRADLNLAIKKARQEGEELK